jgi:hypothetical protein
MTGPMSGLELRSTLMFIDAPMKPVSARAKLYALFSGDRHYHLVVATGSQNRTLCNLSTKGSLRNIRQYRPPAQVTNEPPDPSTHKPCPLCQEARARVK